MRQFSRSQVQGARLAAALLAVALLGAGGCDHFTPKERASQRKAPITAADSAAQVLLGTRHVLTVGGARRAILHADSALLSEDVTRLELRRVRLTLFAPTGESTSVITAPAAVYRLDSVQVTPFQGVTVQAVSGRTLTSQSLVYDARENRLRGTFAYQLRGAGTNRNGEAFEADPALLDVRKPSPKRDTAKKGK